MKLWIEYNPILALQTLPVVVVVSMTTVIIINPAEHYCWWGDEMYKVVSGCEGTGGGVSTMQHLIGHNWMWLDGQWMQVARIIKDWEPVTQCTRPSWWEHWTHQWSCWWRLVDAGAQSTDDDKGADMDNPEAHCVMGTDVDCMLWSGQLRLPP